MRRPLALLSPRLLLVLALLAVVGCGRPAQKRAAAHRGMTRPEPLAVQRPPLTNRACELLTEDDAADVLGGAVGQPVRSLVPAMGVVTSRCGYVAKDAKPAKVVSLLAKIWDNAAEARSAFVHAYGTAQLVSGQAPKALTGLGDRSYWSGGSANELHVLAQGIWMTFSGTAGPGADPQPQDVAAARKALSHLAS